MRIGIDGRYISDHFPGIGRFTHSLIQGLAEVAEAGTTFMVVHNPRVENTRFDLPALGRLPHVELVESSLSPFSLAQQWHLPRLAARLRLDLWHAPYYIAPYRMPCPLVVTIYDAISSRYPQYLPSLAARLTYETAMRLSVATARWVIAISQTSRHDLLRFFGTPPGKVAVVYGAADAHYAPQSPQVVAALRRRLGLPERYVLYLGSNKPHKNLVRLVQAWARVLQQAPAAGAVQLVLAGREDRRFPEARQTADGLGLGGAVRFLGDVAEGDMAALYSGATAFVFPSLFEGFGLPVLEAMACGAPVICSTTPALLEVVGEAALTVDALDVKALAGALGRVLADAGLRRDLARRGLEQARRFSWPRAAQETLDVYQAACERRQ